MRIEGTFLSSAVGRRIFALFLFASTVPIALLALVTFQGMSTLLNRQARAELSAYSKTYGMQVGARLREAEEALARIGIESPDARVSANTGPSGIPMFRSLAVFAGDKVLVTSAAVPVLSPPILADLAAHAVRATAHPGDEAVIVIPGASPVETVLAVVRRRDGDAGASHRLLAVLEPSFLFGDRESLAAQTDICAFTGVEHLLLFCSDPDRAALARAAVENRPGADEGLPQRMDLGQWTLPPTTNLKFTPWTFVSLRPVEIGALADRGIGAIYLKVALACLVMVALLSLVQIRRILVPLERLIEATKRVAVWDFTQPIPVDRQDEFGRLAVSFNEMAKTLDSQIGAMKTLSSIDREILSHLDIDRIIERVLQRLQQLVPGATAAIARLPARSDAGASTALWRSGGDAIERIELPLGTQERSLLAGAGEAMLVQGEQAGASVLAQALVGPGGDRCLMIPGWTQGGACTVIAMGLGAGAAPDRPTVEQIKELGSRVGVAFDAADWQNRLLDEARNDSLTGLPNRLRIHEIIEQRLARQGPDAAPFATLFIDLDRFKGVNDGLGHDAGDALLVQAAHRIRECIQPQDVVARLGGDEFIVLTDDVMQDGRTGVLAQRVIAALSTPYRIGKAEVHVSASIGIAHFPRDGATREALIRNADTALYRAKAQGRGRSVRFQEAMRRAAVAILSLEKDLRAALQRSEIRVHYQPRVLLSDGSLVGAEALARWTHATRGAVAPSEFIALAEEIGLIEELGESVLRQACDLLSARKRQGLVSCPISVNLSARQLRLRDIAQRLLGIVESFGLKPNALELEVTESVLVDDLKTSAAALQRLRGAGFRIALDDFGTGYSSLSYLQNLPIDVMKIDSSFVKDLVSSQGSRAIAVAIVGIAHTLGMRVVAEGVETAEQAAILRQWGCEEAQGFLYSRALPADQFERYISARQPEMINKRTLHPAAAS